MSKEITKPELVEARISDIQAALPANTVEAAQLKLAFLNAFNKKPELRTCTDLSVVNCLMNCSSLGILPETPEQHCYLIPRNQKVGDKYVKVCELTISYRGFSHMILRGKDVTVIDSGIIHKGDRYKMQKGDPVICEFELNLDDPDRENAPVLAAYCLLVFANGARKLEIMDIGELNKVERAMMNQNQGKATPAWKMWRGEMFRKAPIKRIAKTSELGPLVARAAGLDNAAFAQARRDAFQTPQTMTLPDGSKIEIQKHSSAMLPEPAREESQTVELETASSEPGEERDADGNFLF